MGNERNEKLAILNGLAGNYSAVLSDETSKMWLFLLKEYSVAQVQAAALNLIRKHSDVPYKAMPPFAMMQKELDILTGTVRGEENIALQAEAEWNALLEWIEGYGSWRIPDLEPVTARVVRMMGGWQCVCAWLEKDLNWRHKEFVDLWKQVQGKEKFVAIGAKAVKRLETPTENRYLDDLLIEHRPQPEPEPPQVMPQPTPQAITASDTQPQEMPAAPKPTRKDYQPRTACTPSEMLDRAMLLALRDKLRGTQRATA